MKKIFSILLSISLLTINPMMISASNLNDSNSNPTTPFEVDRQMYGDEIDFRIVLYDESRNYVNPNLYNTFQFVPDDGLGGPNYFYKNYFSKIEWISRSGIISLSLTPKVDPVIYKQKIGNQFIQALVIIVTGRTVEIQR